jgi:hypothetical protein
MSGAQPEEAKKYSYRLSGELMTILESEFPIEPLVEKFAEAANKTDAKNLLRIGEEIFGAYGRNLSDRLGELEVSYRDRSAELIYEVAEQTGHFFPSPQQRLLEISLLAVFPEAKWSYDEISYKRLAYMVKRCPVHQSILEKMGKDTADQVPCRTFCLELYTGLCRSTNVLDTVEIKMLHQISEDFGKCVFEAKLKPELL